jgi:hypothetical protein
MRRTLSDTIPVEIESLTECSCGTGRAHLKCDHDLAVSDDDWRAGVAAGNRPAALILARGAAL